MFHWGLFGRFENAEVFWEVMESDEEGKRYINDFLFGGLAGGGISKPSLIPPPLLSFYSDPER